MPSVELWRRSDFDRPTLEVCRALLGQLLVRVEPDESRLSGWIVEAEAYIGQDDLACHARSGLTERNRVMWGPAGHAYLYFTYGMHWMLNLVTEPQGTPSAVLLRALHPVEGLDRIAARRSGRAASEWTDGPAKICQAFDLDGSWNGYDLCQADPNLYLQRAPQVPEHAVTRGPRVGLNNVPEPWKSMPWRLCVTADWEQNPALGGDEQ